MKIVQYNILYDAYTVNELIDKIGIHNPEKIDGKKRVTIEIYFFIGVK